MTAYAIQARDLSKRYRIGRAVDGGNGRKGVFSWRASPFEYLASTFRPATEIETLWALKDVSFDVPHGEVIGIVGRNGAGKSTLLKILSRITEPTSGKAWIRGRVGSLLEVGTGFHPELTGRENIYLSGAILGMKRAEVIRKFDEIIDFAEVERFLDTPVKRYSSGMYVRLAFAVAAHLEPEILMVDEVLAVGDAAFQKKCLGKMGDVATRGRTVVFVSHNMVAVQNLCQRAVWLQDGRIHQSGEARQVVFQYLASSTKALTQQEWPDPATAPGNEMVRIRRVAVRPRAEQVDGITMETPLDVEVEFWNRVPDEHLHVRWLFGTEQQVVAFTSASNEQDPEISKSPLPRGVIRCTCHLPAKLLNEGTYHLQLQVIRNGRMPVFRMEDALSFEVLDIGQRHENWFGRSPGVVRPRLDWQTEIVETQGES
ncbi:MAG TPA: ABC transporter ATP-binding protein [Anaerolineales bacterium]|nr:ABC transporter ATP-binding protein [Anaerolineales bacterium]